jgi:hypothetical protein
MKMLRMAGVVAVVAGSVALAYAASGAVVSKSAEVKGKAAADLAAKYATVCGIKDWHPAVASCEESKEGTSEFRTLTLKDGGKIKEKITSKSADGYAYRIVESPLPVKDYMANFSIKDEGGNAKISWTASFQANGKPEAEAKTIIEGIFDGGLKNLAEIAAK